MFTAEQQAYLAKVADQGLAEEAAAAAREKAIEDQAAADAAAQAKLVQVQTQAQNLVDQNLQGYTVSITPAE